MINRIPTQTPVSPLVSRQPGRTTRASPMRQEAQDEEGVEFRSSPREIRFAVVECWLGHLLAAQSSSGLCALLLGDHASGLRRSLLAQFQDALLIEDNAALKGTAAGLIQFLETPSWKLEIPLDVRGTAFQKRVWSTLREIPAGSTASYADIARRIGSPAAGRAVGQACGANMLAVVIPCHRVVRSDGSLSGYRWGVERKQALLERESAASRSAIASPRVKL